MYSVTLSTSIFTLAPSLVCIVIRIITNGIIALVSLNEEYGLPVYVGIYLIILLVYHTANINILNCAITSNVISKLPLVSSSSGIIDLIRRSVSITGIIDNAPYCNILNIAFLFSVSKLNTYEKKPIFSGVFDITISGSSIFFKYIK